jgi:hypothetical protein
MSASFSTVSQAMQRGVLEENLRLQEQIADLQTKHVDVENRYATVRSSVLRMLWYTAHHQPLSLSNVTWAHNLISSSAIPYLDWQD